IGDAPVWKARGECVEQYGSGEAYLPVLEALGRLCREPGGERVIAVLCRHAPTWMAQMPWFLQDGDREQWSRDLLGATRERMLREMAEAVEVLTADTPLVLVLEDLHWSDYGTVDLISVLAARREPARLLLIGTYRPADAIESEHPLRAVKQELRVRAQCHELPLELLAATDVAEYVRGRFPASGLDATLAPLLHRRADGNPLFTVNMVDDLVARGLLAQRDGGWALTAEIGDVAVGVPSSLSEMIERRIERLDRRAQHVLEAA